MEKSNYENIDVLITSGFESNNQINERSGFKLFKDIQSIAPHLQSNLKNLQFSIVTPIQREVLEYINNRKDVVACAQTGSGKTIAYLLPIANHMFNNFFNFTDTNNNYKPYSNDNNKFNNRMPIENIKPILLILTPTRELASQIFIEARKLLYKTGIIVCKIFGGVSPQEQLKSFSLGCDILIATPGRLLDFIKFGNISLNKVKFLILDEADRMLEMGFQPQLNKIAFNSDLPLKEERQNLLFSATFDESVKTISKKFINTDFYFIKTTYENNPFQNIKQVLYYAKENEKMPMLLKMLDYIKGSIISKKKF